MLSRRSVLAAGTLGALGLATGVGLTACGSSTSSVGELGPQLVALFNPNRIIAAGVPQRLPFGLVDNGITLTGDGAPVTARVLADGEVIDTAEVIGRVVAHDHPAGTTEHQHSGLLRYYALRTTLPSPGVYDVEFDIGGVTASSPVQAFDPDEVGVLLPGAPFPSMITPTVADPGGIDALCTQPDGPCPFHEHTVADVLVTGQPMAVLVATPAFCSTAYCGPVLDTLIEAAPSYPGIAMIHLEPYANARAVNGDLTSPDLQLASTSALGPWISSRRCSWSARNGVLVVTASTTFGLEPGLNRRWTLLS
ncbi:MAG: hypothetical protein R2710_21205 [Acidimicrobiales bacterium]